MSYKGVSSNSQSIYVDNASTQFYLKNLYFIPETTISYFFHDCFNSSSFCIFFLVFTFRFYITPLRSRFALNHLSLRQFSFCRFSLKMFGIDELRFQRCFPDCFEQQSLIHTTSASAEVGTMGPAEHNFQLLIL